MVLKFVLLLAWNQAVFKKVPDLFWAFSSAILLHLNNWWNWAHQKMTLQLLSPQTAFCLSPPPQNQFTDNHQKHKNIILNLVHTARHWEHGLSNQKLSNCLSLSKTILYFTVHHDEHHGTIYTLKNKAFYIYKQKCFLCILCYSPKWWKYRRKKWYKI